ncbi:MAG TPA: protein kinase, partial [Pirellulales bacterium]|nr:protein kinase [Pirellulales bacterium]
MTQHLTSQRQAASAASRDVRHAATGLPISVGPWQLVEPLHLGETTSTYLAKPSDHSDGPCQYVVKVLSKDSASDGPACTAIRREAYVGRKVSHPHLISVLDANVQSEPYFLTMPLVAGETLRQAMRRQPILPAPVVFWIIRQVADALSGLHAAGWIHGDVKPENILIAPDGHVTLLDLG